MAALRRYAGLLRERDFRRLWMAQTVSQVGTQVTNLALPLVAILVLNASAFEVALLGAIEFLPFVFFTLPAMNVRNAILSSGGPIAPFGPLMPGIE